MKGVYESIKTNFINRIYRLLLYTNDTELTTL